MIIRRIFKIFPIPVFYVSIDNMNFAGVSYGIFIRIKKRYINDIGLLEAELQHCRQFYRTLGFSALLYLFSKKYKYKYELEAYKVQLTYIDEKDRERVKGKFALFLATRYSLDLDAESILADL